jgi:hypothetical protein
MSYRLAIPLALWWSLSSLYSPSCVPKRVGIGQYVTCFDGTYPILTTYPGWTYTDIVMTIVVAAAFTALVWLIRD